MTDRELLELAAKAAGYDYTVHHHGGQDYNLAINGVYWYPLHDDGDALRLADALNQQAVWEGHYGPSYLRDLLLEAAAELRRAIVRAAAEIGRNMK